MTVKPPKLKQFEPVESKAFKEIRIRSVREWGKIIIDLRTCRNMAQRQLAELAGINRTTLRRIEDGIASGDIAVIERILSVFGYELEALKV